MSRVLAAVLAYARSRPEQIAVSGAAAAYTWPELQPAIEVTAERLQDALADAAPTAPVAIVLDNGPAWVLLDLALVHLGRAALPLPPFFTREQMMHAVADAGCALLVRPPLTDDEPAERIADALVVVQALPFPVKPLHTGTAKITYTSGSTGQPRGACLSQAQMEATAASLVDVIGRDYAGVHMPILPLGVLLENVAGLYPTLLAGGHYHAPGLRELGFVAGLKPDISRIVAEVRDHRVTSLILVPELLRALTAWLVAEDVRLPMLRLVAVGGAKVSPQLIAAARSVGLPAYEGYGLTECASVVALNTPSAERGGSVGRLLPHLQASVSDAGELIVGRDTFLGYLGAPAPPPDWATGDLGEIDPNGFIVINGRKSNLLITSYGRNVAPEWVESELLAQPEIAQAVVFGEGAAELCAILVPADPEACVEQAVTRANASLPVYARVGRWRAAAQFDAGRGELTPNGRPRRAVLREAHRDFIELDS